MEHEYTLRGTTVQFAWTTSALAIQSLSMVRALGRSYRSRVYCWKLFQTLRVYLKILIDIAASVLTFPSRRIGLCVYFYSWPVVLTPNGRTHQSIGFDSLAVWPNITYTFTIPNTICPSCSGSLYTVATSSAFSIPQHERDLIPENYPDFTTRPKRVSIMSLSTLKRAKNTYNTIVKNLMNMRNASPHSQQRVWSTGSHPGHSS